jgi:hypothetical protein
MPGSIGPPRNPVGYGCAGVLLGLLIPAIALSGTGRLALVLAPLFSVIGGVAGFAIAYRIQKPQHQGRQQVSEDWPGYGFAVGVAGAFVGFTVVLLLAFAGIVNNDGWLVVGALGGAVVGAILYFFVSGLLKRA